MTGKGGLFTICEAVLVISLASKVLNIVIGKQACDAFLVVSTPELTGNTVGASLLFACRYGLVKLEVRWEWDGIIPAYILTMVIYGISVNAVA